MPPRTTGAQGPATHAFHQRTGNVRKSGAARIAARTAMMRGYEGHAQVMADVAAVIEQAQREGRDLATALRIARVTLAYVSGPEPEPDQARALEALDRQLRSLAE